MVETKLYYTVAEVAEMMGLSRRHTRRVLVQARVRLYRPGKRKILIPFGELLLLLARHRANKQSHDEFLTKHKYE